MSTRDASDFIIIIVELKIRIENKFPCHFKLSKNFLPTYMAELQK
jgi:hypothetical protein